MYLLEHVIIMSLNWIKMYCWWFGVGQPTHEGSCFWGKESQIFCENKQEYGGLICSHLLMSQSVILLGFMSLWYFYQGYWRWKIFFDVFVFFLCIICRGWCLLWDVDRYVAELTSCNNCKLLIIMACPAWQLIKRQVSLIHWFYKVGLQCVAQDVVLGALFFIVTKPGIIAPSSRHNSLQSIVFVYIMTIVLIFYTCGWLALFRKALNGIKNSSRQLSTSWSTGVDYYQSNKLPWFESRYDQFCINTFLIFFSSWE